MGIQSEANESFTEEVISEAQTYSQWGPNAPDFNRIHHLNQSMGRSSTNMPEFFHIKVRSNYDNLSQVKYNPDGHWQAYSESMQESIQSIQEEQYDGKEEGYMEDEEDIIPQPDPRKRSKLHKIKKMFEINANQKYFKCAKFN